MSYSSCWTRSGNAEKWGRNDVGTNAKRPAYRGSSAVPPAWLREASARSISGDVRPSATDVTIGRSGSARARRRGAPGDRTFQPPGRLHPFRRHGGCLLHGAFPQELVAYCQWRRPRGPVLLHLSVSVRGRSRSLERGCAAELAEERYRLGPTVRLGR